MSDNDNVLLYVTRETRVRGETLDWMVNQEPLVSLERLDETEPSD